MAKDVRSTTGVLLRGGQPRFRDARCLWDIEDLGCPTLAVTTSRHRPRPARPKGFARFGASMLGALVFVFVVALALTLAAPRAWGQEGEGPGKEELRPGDTAFGQEAGELELAFETLFVDGVEEDEIELRVEVEYGLTSRLQIGCELPYLFVDPREPGEPSEDGFDAALLSLQFGLLGADAPLALSLVAESEIPFVGREGPGSDEVKPAAAILLARVVGSHEIFGGIKRTFTSDHELELEFGGVFVKGRLATEISAGWIRTREGSAWVLSPEFIIEDVGPFDLGIGFPYTFLDGPDEWGFGITLTL